MPFKRPAVLSLTDEITQGPSKRGRTNILHSHHDLDQCDSSACDSGFPGLSQDFTSSLSDELLVRILSYFPLSILLGISSVSRRFHRLSSDSQLWRQLYYLQFVLPRALRIPGFRSNPFRHDTLNNRTILRHSGVNLRKSLTQGDSSYVDWKRQYKLRHNWSRGRCAVEELDVGSPKLVPNSPRGQTLAKTLHGVAFTADFAAGLRAWDLRSKRLLACIGLDSGITACEPTCLAVDDQTMDERRLGVALGFIDGSFGVWTLDLTGELLVKQYYYHRAAGGKLVSLAYHFPYLLVATSHACVFLYAFDMTSKQLPDLARKLDASPSRSSQPDVVRKGNTLSTAPLPRLVTSLKSHATSTPPALSIRKMPSSTAISIAYTLLTREGWTIGVQELQLRAVDTQMRAIPEVYESRMAYAPPTITGQATRRTPRRIPRRLDSEVPGLFHDEEADISEGNNKPLHGPMSLCYTHPYLLAIQPDNTLILYLCTTGSTGLSISRGIRLWGHTSGIGGAEITSRGKAVSVSYHGDEIRVWELEGRSGGRSIRVSPNPGDLPQASTHVPPPSVWDDRRSWVGFDDEMVIVLKQTGTGREALMVYDFS